MNTPSQNNTRHQSHPEQRIQKQRQPSPAHPTPAPQSPWRGVFFDGPQSDQNQDGDEVPVWVVYVGDADAEPLHKVYYVHHYAAARSLARRMSADRNLELIDEASPE